MVVAPYALVLVFIATLFNGVVEGKSTGLTLTEGHGLGVYNGEEVDIKSFPYLVSIVADSNDDNVYTGTIVSESWVITAAAWTYRVNPLDVTVYSGDKESEHGDAFAVNMIVKHPNFTRTSYEYQIACIQIIGTFEWSSEAAKVTLPKKPIKGTPEFLVAGYGDDSNGNNLLFGAMKWMSPSFCSAAVSDWGITWSDNLACAYNRSSTTLCEGDIGTGFVKAGVIDAVFVGVVDTESECSERSWPIILNPVYPLVDWIQEVTGIKSK